MLRAKFKAQPPEDMPKGSPFGPNLRALVIYLRFTQGHRLRAAGDSVVRSPRSRHQRGRARQHPRRRAGRLHRAEPAAIRARLLAGTILQSDETGLRVGKKNWWLWVFHHDDSAFSSPRPRAPRKWSRIFSATSGPISGCPTATAAKWAGRTRTIRSASPISSATCNTPSTPATTCSRPELRHLLGRACRIGRRKSKTRRRDPENLCTRGSTPASTNSWR